MSPDQLERLAKASRYYLKRGFVYEPVPWYISSRADEISKPPEANPLNVLGLGIMDNRLLASGEQGFIQRILDRDIEDGFFQTCTPCFRDEKELDELHQLYFTKLELAGIGCGTPLDFAQLAWEFFKDYVPCEVVKLGTDRYDIFCGDIELGSYGYRVFYRGDEQNPVKLTYGTGLAEPRLSVAIGRVHK